MRNEVHVREAIEAGAQFLVWPIFFEALVTLGKQHEVVTAPRRVYTNGDSSVGVRGRRCGQGVPSGN